MTVRLVVIRLMLVSLFAAAGMTVLVVTVFSDESIAMRTVGTCAIIAVACGLMLPVLPRSDSVALTPAAYGWMALLCAESLLLLLLMWSDTIRRVQEDAIAILALFTGFSYVPIAVALRVAASPERGQRRLAWLAGGLVAAAAIGPLLAMLAAGVGVISSSRLDRAAGMWFALVVPMCCAATCLPGLLAPPARVVRVLSVLGILMALVDSALWSAVILRDMFSQVPMVQLGTSLGFVAGAFATWSIAGTLPLGKIERRMVPVIVVLLGLSAALAWWTADGESHHTIGFLPERLLTASLVVAFALSVAVVVLFRVGARRASRSLAIESVELTCPRCGKRGRVSSGRDACKHCGLKVLIAFEDVQCPKCRQNVSHVGASGVCPECGTSIERSSLRFTESTAFTAH